MTGKRIGYIRVSTPEQNPDRQLEGVILDKKFIEYASAKNMDRPQLKFMMDYVREDDTIYVHSMDRLARNVKDLRNLVDNLISKKVQIHFLKENLIFDGVDNPMSNLMLSLMGAFAEFEHAFIMERQREGIEAAKKSKKFKGGHDKLNVDQIEFIKNLLAQRKSIGQISRDLGVCRVTLYKFLYRHQLKQKSTTKTKNEN